MSTGTWIAGNVILCIVYIVRNPSDDTECLEPSYSTMVWWQLYALLVASQLVTVLSIKCSETLSYAHKTNSIHQIIVQ